MRTNLLKTAVVGLSIMAFASGCGKGSGSNPTISGVTGPNVTYVNGQFTMSIVLTQLNIEGGGQIPIPHMPNSYLEISPDLQSTGTLIQIGLSPTDLAALTGGAVNLLPPTDLPGGRALPGVSGGQLPAIAVQVPSWDNITFYVGPQIFGLFVPVKLGLAGYEATFRFYDTAGLDIGNISVVGEDTTGANSGFLVLIPIQGAVANIVNAAKAN
jgi:hypothetical protein